MKNKLLLLLLIATTISGKAQYKVSDTTIFTTCISAIYAYQFPNADLAKRFGNNSSIGSSFHIKTKSNIIFGLEGAFMFGNKVKEPNLMHGIKTSQGEIIDQQGIYAEIRLFERGFNVMAKGGKLLPLFGPNPNSGLAVIGGLGFLQHKIRLENPENTAPQIKDDYKKGYDRLSNGLATSLFIGYYNMSNSRLLNFFIGGEVMQAWTKNRRTYNFDIMGKDDKLYNDRLFSIKFGWMLPLYKRAPLDYYYN